MLPRFLENITTKYSFVEVIHTGVSSEIYLVHDTSGNEYALKLFKKDVTDIIFKNELEICKLLCNVENPDFIRYISSSEEDKVTNAKYIVFELFKKHSLADFINPDNPLGEKLIKFIFYQICKMVERLHKLHFSHRDLNLNNILMDQYINLKLGDFGSAKYCLNQNGCNLLLSDKIDTPYYTPPEVGKRPYDGQKVDIFSLGVLLLYMRTGKQIFEIHKEKIYKLIKKQKYENFWYIVESGDNNMKFTPEFKDLINSMLDYNYKNRPETADILNHPYFDEIRCLDYDGFLAYEKAIRKKMKEIEETFDNNE